MDPKLAAYIEALRARGLDPTTIDALVKQRQMQMASGGLDPADAFASPSSPMSEVAAALLGVQPQQAAPGDATATGLEFPTPEGTVASPAPPTIGAPGGAVPGSLEEAMALHQFNVRHDLDQLDPRHKSLATVAEDIPLLGRVLQGPTFDDIREAEALGITTPGEKAESAFGMLAPAFGLGMAAPRLLPAAVQRGTGFANALKRGAAAEAAIAPLYTGEAIAEGQPIPEALAEGAAFGAGGALAEGAVGAVQAGKLIARAMRLPDGTIVTGESFADLARQLPPDDEAVLRTVMGYVDDKGRFYDQNRAGRIAQRTGQIREDGTIRVELPKPREVSDGERTVITDLDMPEAQDHLRRTSYSRLFDEAEEQNRERLLAQARERFGGDVEVEITPLRTERGLSDPTSGTVIHTTPGDPARGTTGQVHRAPVGEAPVIDNLNANRRASARQDRFTPSAQPAQGET